MDITQSKRIVVKVGTSTLTHESGMLNMRRIQRLVTVLADIIFMGKELILVSSGAIGVGSPRLSFPNGKASSTMEKQAAAAIGQIELMNIYSEMFSKYGIMTGQMLLTKDVIDLPTRKQNAVNTLGMLIEQGVLPIINENDSVSTYEIEFGDNDTLSAYVAQLCEADLLILLTDIDGLYTENPQTNPDAQLISIVEEITDEIREMAGGVGTRRGTGGMKTKIAAAEIATQAGCNMIIISGTNPENLYEIFDGQPIGTTFVAKEN